MEEIITLITNNGIGVVCVGYLIFFQHFTMSKISSAMVDMTNILGIMKNELQDMKEEIKELKNKKGK